MRDYKAHSWINARGPFGGHQANVRKNVSLADVSRHEYPYTLLLSLIYSNRAADGTPSDSGEWQRLDRTEERIADRFCIEHGALFGMVVTSDGTRDVFLFLPESLDDSAVDAVIQSATPEVDYRFEIIHDPAWIPYDRILPKNEST
jgi:hypothetical protein